MKEILKQIQDDPTMEVALSKMFGSAQTFSKDQVNQDEIEEIKSKFIVKGKPLVVSAKELLKYDTISLRLCMAECALYVWPTLELKAWIEKEIPDLSKTIEIGSGNGVLAQALGVPATDNYMQSRRFIPKNKAEADMHRDGLLQYDLMRQARIQYGENVEQLDALDAIRKYKPRHVFGCYITHRHRKGMSQGNALGVDEDWIYKRRQIKTYTVFGNLKTHEAKPLLKIPHEEIEIDGLIVRAAQQELARAFRWTTE